MKSRTNAQQELMRQQMIEEERNSQFQKSQNPKISPSFKMSKSSPRIINSLPVSDKNINVNKSVGTCDMSSKPLIYRSKFDSIDSQLNKRHGSSSYSVMLNHCTTKPESFSQGTKSPMDLAFSNLGNDDALDWNQIEPSITSTSEISQDLLDQITRGQHDTIHESFMETGTEENDSLQDDQSVSSMKPSTSCPTNMAQPTNITSEQSVHFNQFGKATLKMTPCSTPVTGVVEDQKLQWMRDRNKKDCHNRIERKRRDYINNQILELGQLLPEKLFLSTESKRNKGGILKNSVIYIQQLQQVLNCLQHLQKETQLSENLISAFYKRIQYLEQLLVQSGISFDENTNEKLTLQDWFNVHQHNSVLLQNVNNIQSSWSAEHNDGDKISVYDPCYDEVLLKSEDVNAEKILNSVSLARIHSSNSGAGGSSSGTQSITNYSSPISITPVTNSQSNNNNSNSNPSNHIRSSTTQSSNHAQQYGSSQPFSKTGIKLYEPSSKSCISDSPVLSSILIGSGETSATTKQNNEQFAASRHSQFSGLSSSVPDGSRSGYLTQRLSSESSAGERYYLIPISKTKGLQLMSNDLKISRGIIKVDTNMSNIEEPVASHIQSEPSSSSRISILNSYSISRDDDIQNIIDEDSLMGEFEFDDIHME